MSETSNTELIAEIRAGNMEDRSWMIDALDRAANALESSTATHTETEADLQASRGREEALRAEIAKVKALLDTPDDDGVTWWVWIEDGLGGTLHDELRAILDAAPSPTLEAVKAETVPNITAEMVERAAIGLDEDAFSLTPEEFRSEYGGFPEWSSGYQASRQRRARQTVRSVLAYAFDRPVATEGESRG